MNRESFRRLLEERVLVLDGAMGTMLQESHAEVMDCPELYNLKLPHLVEGVHRAYIEAGCDIIQTNTFGASRLKLAKHGLEQSFADINRCAVELARGAAGDKVLVAGSIGPLGDLLQPWGAVSFDVAYEAFLEQARELINAGVDLINIETMSDLHEAKIAVMAARAAGKDIPVLCSLTYTASLRTLTGGDPVAAMLTLKAAGADVVGTNCGFGPDMLLSIVQQQGAVSDMPLLVQPNAGLPEVKGGNTVFSLTPQELAHYVAPLVAAGANIIGGCCGTTPAHMALVANTVTNLSPERRLPQSSSTLAGSSSVVFVGEKQPTALVGERINPTARKSLREALLARDYSRVAEDALAQLDAGATIIDVNVGVNLDEEQQAELMAGAISRIQAVRDVPICIDATSPRVIERALQVTRGKPLINSVSGKADSLAAIIPLAVKFGAAIIGLTIDEAGIPVTAQERLRVAKRIVDRALQEGIAAQDIYIDTLTLTAGAEQALVPETLKALALVKRELGVRTVLGVSNVSYGLPLRQPLNSAFVAMAVAHGLDMVIGNPGQEDFYAVIKASDVLLGRDIGAARYIHWSQEQSDRVAGKQEAPSSSAPQATKKNLADLVYTGARESVLAEVKALLAGGVKPLQIMEEGVVAGLEQAGTAYEQQQFFLPQLLLAAEAAEVALRELEPLLKEAEGGGTGLGTVVMATVKGDVHDIGKNIVCLLLKNHGFRVVDMGKDVSCEAIVHEALAQKADIIGLSALMTTTMGEMATVTTALRERNISIPVLVGGAVVTEQYADAIGAHYASDAPGAVRKAREIMARGEVSCPQA